VHLLGDKDRPKPLAAAFMKRNDEVFVACIISSIPQMIINEFSRFSNQGLKPVWNDILKTISQ
jgi:hypothetical protein